MIFDKTLGSITEPDIQALIDAQVAEQKTLEYKRILPDGSNSEKKEFLADVSSFANTAGGYILYGVEEQAGLPTKISGIQLDDVDACKLRLEDMLRNGINPRLPHVEIHPVALASGYYVLILHIQKSWLSPHRVVFQQYGHFYARSSAGKFQLDVTELRTAFELSGITAERIRDFRTERLSRISAGEEIPTLLEERSPKLVLHMIPSSAFNSSISVDLKVFNDYSRWDLVRPIAVWDIAPPISTRFNLDGIARAAQWTRNAVAPVMIPSGYVQVFRNGIVEIVDVTILEVNGENRVFSGEVFELRLLQAVKKHLELQRFLEVEPPMFIMVSLLGVKGYKIPRGSYPANYTEEIDRANLIMPEVMIDTFDVSNDHIAEIMRPIFDTTWNAANYPFSPNYNEDGKYVRGWN